MLIDYSLVAVMAISKKFGRAYHYTKCYEVAAQEAKFDSEWLTSLIVANSLLCDLVVAVDVIVVVIVVSVLFLSADGLAPGGAPFVSVNAAVDDVICCGGGRGNRRRNHECFSAAAGVIRYSGSHSRQPHKKFMNNGSSHPFSAFRRLFDPGVPRVLPCRELPAPRITRPSSSVSTEQ